MAHADLLPGTLDLLILTAVSLGPLYGYGALLRIELITAGTLLVEQGALYPAFYRLERQGLLNTEWGTSDNSRRAKFYTLIAAGRKRLRAETERWNRRKRSGRSWPGSAVIVQSFRNAVNGSSLAIRRAGT